MPSCFARGHCSCYVLICMGSHLNHFPLRTDTWCHSHRYMVSLSPMMEPYTYRWLVHILTDDWSIYSPMMCSYTHLWLVHISTDDRIEAHFDSPMGSDKTALPVGQNVINHRRKPVAEVPPYSTARRGRTMRMEAAIGWILWLIIYCLRTIVAKRKSTKSFENKHTWVKSIGNIFKI